MLEAFESFQMFEEGMTWPHGWPSAHCSRLVSAVGPARVVKAVGPVRVCAVQSTRALLVRFAPARRVFFGAPSTRRGNVVRLRPRHRAARRARVGRAVAAVARDGAPQGDPAPRGAPAGISFEVRVREQLVPLRLSKSRTR